MHDRANDVIGGHFNHQPNFLTPYIERRATLHPRLFVELSSGRGISGGEIFGVTFVRVERDGTTTSRHNISECFDSRRAAESHIARVARLVR